MAELRPVGQSLQRLLSKWGLERQFAIRHALSAWEEIVGEPIARVARPLRFENDTLWVAVRTPTWAQELSFHKTTILQRLNERIASHLSNSEPVLKNLRFVVRNPLPSRFGLGSEGESPLKTSPTDEIFFSADREGNPSANQEKKISDIELSESELVAIANSFADVADERLRTALIRARIASLRYERWRR